MATMVSSPLSDFGTNCIKCRNELIAPEKSEYWDRGHIRHLWLCPRCMTCFESLTPCCANSEAFNEITSRDDISQPLRVA